MVDTAYGLDYYFSQKYQLDFMKSCGLGALKSSMRNNGPPYSLSEAAKYCFITKPSLDDRGRPLRDGTLCLNLKEVFQSDADMEKWMVLEEKKNSDREEVEEDEDEEEKNTKIGETNLLKEMFYRPADNWYNQFKYSIKYGVISDFMLSVFDSDGFSNYCDDESVLEDEKLTVEQIMDYMLNSANSIKNIRYFPDHSIMQELRTHPFFWLLRMIAWNPSACCPPLQTIESSEDFFKIFTVKVRTVYVYLKYMFFV